MSCFFGAEENKIFTYTNQINIQVFLIEKKAEGKLKAANHPSFFGCEKKNPAFLVGENTSIHGTPFRIISQVTLVKAVFKSVLGVLLPPSLSR